MSASKSQLPSPTCSAIIVCDGVIEDRRTNKKSLIGLFNRVLCRQIPTTLQQLTIFVQLTGGHGKYKLSVRLISLSHEAAVPVIEIGGTVEFPSPTDVVEIVFELKPVAFEVEGKHSIEVLANGIPIGATNFIVSKLEKSDE